MVGSVIKYFFHPTFCFKLHICVFIITYKYSSFKKLSMKKSLIFLSAAAILFACNKSNDSNSISLTASAIQVAVGQTVAVTATTNVNTLSWSATPAATSVGAYAVTTEKTNYYSFSSPGIYTIGVRARGLDLDSVHICNHGDSVGHHLPDSIWNHRIDSIWHLRGHDRGQCKNGQDSASIVIQVK
jgi:plastocyanin